MRFFRPVVPMDILSLVVIAVGLTMDSFAVCIGRSMCRKRFQVSRALKIAVVFGLFQGLMPLAGYALGIGFEAWIRQLDHWLAFTVLIVIGVKMIYESFLPKNESDCADCNCLETRYIDWKNIFTLAFATSIDAMATGLVFVTYPGTILRAMAIIGVVCFVFCFVGMFLGVHLGKKINFRIEMIGGIILIAIGIKILLEHVLFS